MIRHRAQTSAYEIDDAAERIAGEASAWDEAWCTTESGIILESGFANVFWRLPRGDAKSNGRDVICTPSSDLMVYIGTSTKVVLELMKQSPINAIVRMGHYRLDDIPANANVFRNNRSYLYHILF
jgi:branched-subunit amino acid aminotransferase/4-amino-4-deoxychorismate lyase